MPSRVLDQARQALRRGHPARRPARLRPALRLRRPGRAARGLRHVFRDLDARYVISIGIDDRPFSGQFLVAHDFAFDAEHVLASVIAQLPADDPRVDSISDLVPARELGRARDARPARHRAGGPLRTRKRLVLPDGWPDGVHPLRKDVPWNQVPEDYDRSRDFDFDEPPAGLHGRAASAPSTRRSTSRPTSGSSWRARWCAAASTAASWCTAGSRSSPRRCSPTTTSR